ncbi:MAG: ABC transporter permease [Bacillota bacterium]
MRVIIALAAKDIKLLLRDPMGFFFTLVFPLIMSVFFGVVFSGNGGRGVRGVPVVIIDEDQSDASRGMVALLKQTQELSATQMAGREAALGLVRRGSQASAIILPRGFGALDYHIFRGRPLRLIVAADPSRRAEAAMIRGLLAARGYQYLQNQVSNPRVAQRMVRQALEVTDGLDEIPFQVREVLQPFLRSLDTMLSGFSPATAPVASESMNAGHLANAEHGFELVRVESLPVAGSRQTRNAYAISFPQGIVWGLIGCAASFGISLVIERNHGTLTRLCVSPISRGQVLLGKGLACFATTVTVAAGLLVVAYALFDVRPRSPLLLAAGISCCAVAFVGMMMLMSVLGKTERAAAGMGWAIMLMMSMIGGGMVPLMFMPQWLVAYSDWSPVKWAILAIEGPLWRGFSASEMLLPCGVLLSVGAAGLLLGARIFSRLRSL